MIHESGTGARLTQIIYGWRNYDYYKKEMFCKTDIDGFINGDLSFLEPRNEQSRAILSGFKSWLSIDKEQKVALFTARYKQFKVAAKDKDHNEDNEWKAFFESVHEVAKAGKLEEFISRSKIK